MIISPNMLKLVTESEQKFKERYVEHVSEISLSAPFKKGKEIHALANYFLKGQNIEKLENSLDKNRAYIWKTLKENQYFNMECVDCEYGIQARLDKFWIGGRIDALVKEGKNYYILDYKTGQIPKNATFDFQTMVYLYCVDKLIKYYESLNFVYIGLKENVSEKIDFDKKIAEKYKELILKGCLQIKKLL